MTHTYGVAGGGGRRRHIFKTTVASYQLSYCMIGLLMDKLSLLDTDYWPICKQCEAAYARASKASGTGAGVTTRLPIKSRRAGGTYA